MKLIKGKNLGGFDLMAAPDGTCPECGVAHDKEQPHNQQSLLYQYKFFNDNGRWPTWKDAMAHCPEEVKKLWIEELTNKGIKI